MLRARCHAVEVSLMDKPSRNDAAPVIERLFGEVPTFAEACAEGRTRAVTAGV